MPSPRDGEERPGGSALGSVLLVRQLFVGIPTGVEHLESCPLLSRPADRREFARTAGWPVAMSAASSSRACSAASWRVPSRASWRPSIRVVCSQRWRAWRGSGCACSRKTSTRREAAIAHGSEPEAESWDRRPSWPSQSSNFSDGGKSHKRCTRCDSSGSASHSRDPVAYA